MTELRSDVDLTALRALLDGPWAHIRHDARKLLNELPPLDAYTDKETYRTAVANRIRVLAETGQPHAGFPKEYGGGGDIGGSVVAFEMLGFGDLSLMVKSGVQWGLFGGAIQALGTEQHHARYLPSAMDFTLPGCFAMTETGHGSDVQNIRTTATYDSETQEFVVHTPDKSARKDYIGNAARDGKLAVVFAQLVTKDESHGVHALLVPIRNDDGQPCHGVTIEDCGDKAGLNGVDNGRLTFDHVRVPREALLNKYGNVALDGTYLSPIEGSGRRFFTMLGTLVRGRISVAGGAGSATKRALGIAIKYANSRTQFRRGDSTDEVVILDYLAHQRRLLPALATTYALHFAQEELVRTLHELHSMPEEQKDEQRQRELESRAAGLKAVSTWHATKTIQKCRESCGGFGYLAESQLPQLKADTDVFTTFEGDNTVLLQLVAKSLLTNYRDHVGDLDTLGLVRFAATQFAEAVIERTAARAVINSLANAGRNDTSLFDRGWQLDLFEDRETHMLDGLARRLRKATSDNGFDVFNAAQDHVLRVAKAHIDRVVLQAFIAAIDRCDSPDLATLLGKVCDLYVLSTVESDKSWFLEHGRLTPTRTKTITQAVNTLCRQLRPHAALLVDAF